MEHYNVVTASNHSMLISKVNILISKGWMVTGGVTAMIDPDSGRREFYQAMVFIPKH